MIWIDLGVPPLGNLQNRQFLGSSSRFFQAPWTRWQWQLRLRPRDLHPMLKPTPACLEAQGGPARAGKRWNKVKILNHFNHQPVLKLWLWHTMTLFRWLKTSTWPICLLVNHTCLSCLGHRQDYGYPAVHPKIAAKFGCSPPNMASSS